METRTESEVTQAIDHLFRNEYRKIVSVLASRYSSDYLPEIEDAVQEALIKAVKAWSFSGMPDDPTRWLYRVASNAFIDFLRRDRKSGEKVPEEAGWQEQEPDEVQDDQLKMIFACCHPNLGRSDQLMLSLSILGGFHVREIARALFKSEEAAKKAIQRARERFRKEVGHLELPDTATLEARLDAVLQVIYLWFNEGYNTTAGASILRKDLCLEAMALARLVLEHPRFDRPEVHALLALMHFKVARFDARTGPEGEIITLEFQDRTRWDTEHLQLGFDHMDRSQAGMRLTSYHVEAAISSYYVSAPAWQETDWQAILDLYDLLLRMKDSWFVRMNRAVVLAQVRGPQEALEVLDTLQAQAEGHYLFHSIRADLLKRSGDLSGAGSAWEKALSLTQNPREQELLQTRLESLKQAESVPPTPAR